MSADEKLAVALGRRVRNSSLGWAGSDFVVLFGWMLGAEGEILDCGSVIGVARIGVKAWAGDGSSFAFFVAGRLAELQADAVVLGRL